MYLWNGKHIKHDSYIQNVLYSIVLSKRMLNESKSGGTKENGLGTQRYKDTNFNYFKSLN